MRILFSTFGSYGDLYPYLAIGGELLRRGHQVSIATCPTHRTKVASAGLSFHPVRPDLSLDDREFVTYMMNARHGGERIVQWLAAAVRDSYHDVLEAASERVDLIITHPLTFASILAVRKLGLPWISTVTAPLSMLSAYDPPVLGGAPWVHWFRFLGPRVTRKLLNLDQRRYTACLHDVLRFQIELGLGDRLFAGPESLALLAMFSRSLASPQPDWPRQTVVTGFPFLDDGELPEKALRFLEAGSSPVVFTLGSSAVSTAGDFYQQSLSAIADAGARAIFLTGSHTQGLPARLPDFAMALPYAPHAPIFSRAACIVHHGGAGTAGQAMRAGRPMLVVPFGHDQMDNAERLRRIGAAEVLLPSRYTARRAAQQLRRLLNGDSYARAATRLAGTIQSENGARAAADVIEHSGRPA